MSVKKEERTHTSHTAVTSCDLCLYCTQSDVVVPVTDKFNVCFCVREKQTNKQKAQLHHTVALICVKKREPNFASLSFLYFLI